MYDYNDPEFLQWMQQNYPQELQGQFGMQGGGYGMPMQRPMGMAGGIGSTLQFAASNVPKIQAATNAAKQAATAGEKAAGTGEKAAGIMSPYLSTGMFGAGALLQALQGDPMEKYRKNAYNKAQGMLGSDVINVGGAINQNRAAVMPQMSQMAQGYNKRFGLNSGMAQQQMLGGLMNKEAGFNLNASMQNDKLKSQRDQYLLGMLGNAR